MEDREKLIREKIAEKESIESMQLSGIKHIIYKMLLREKGFHPEDIQIDPQFSLQVDTHEATVGIDFSITLEGTTFMVIRCVPSGINSWERYAIAFARAIKDYQIPYAVVADGEQVRVFDIINYTIKQEPAQELFTRKEAMILMKDFQKIPYPEDRREKEKRIIHAFEGIKCQIDRNSNA
jgi:hypothetical protein